MEDFPATDSAVAVIAKMLRKDNGILKHGGLVTPARTVGAEGVSVDPGTDGMDTGHDGNPGRVTGRSGAMGIRESDGSFCESLKVRGLNV